MIQHLSRTVRWRRNALVGIYFGLIGIFAGIFLVIFRSGIFSDHSDEVVLGMMAFLGGYAGVLTGCGYWAKAKAWDEAVVCIGLMPLGILFIPFVRIVVLVTAPMLLPLGMILMTLAMVVVVACLPDKSGFSRRRDWWNRE